MVTMVLIGSGALMLTMFLMRRTAAGRRDRSDGIRWRGIDWSQADRKDEDEEDQFKKSQD
jgi:hypothetical protein